MAQLYTLEINKLSFIHHADGTVEERRKVEMMTGVPGQLVTTWKQMHPDSVIRVTPERPGQDRRAKGGRRFERREPVRTPAATKTARPVAAPGIDLGALINAEMEKLA